MTIETVAGRDRGAPKPAVPAAGLSADTPAVSYIVSLTLALWLVLFTIELAASVLLCDGRLVFTLDDPYIHLAVAGHILSGGYGVNASELSSPSSSIIWPYFLALTEALRLGAFGPLLIAALAAGATVVTMLRLLVRARLFDGEGERPFAYAVAVLLVFLASAIALPMTGLEHSLHAWVAVTTFAGLVGAISGQAPNRLHFAALILLPLIRFEGAAFALAAIAGFALLGHRRFAAAAAIVIALCLAAYAASMAWRGLPLLPSSVLLKAGIAEAAYEHRNAFSAILTNLVASLISPYGQRLLLLCLAIIGCAWCLRADRKALVVCGAVVAAISAHLAFGQYDWFYRYEVYIIALAAVALAWSVAQLKATLDVRAWVVTRIALMLLLAFVATPYVSAALITPFAARNIYEQQYQMGRFVREFYRHPVAVNDLGLVAYENKNFVLDLWGLGSEPVRKAKLAEEYGPAQMATLAFEHHVDLVMIFDRWFIQGVPWSWTKVAVLHTPLVSAAGTDVAFYRTPTADAAELMQALAAFAATLPPRDRLEILAR
jgi:hypothetical protein